MNSPQMLSALNAEDGDVVAGERLGNALLGFHGIEYILFADGHPKSASAITANDWIYVAAVAGDQPSWVAEETLAGGELGTTFNQSASAYEDPTPATERAGMSAAFKYGEFFFEHTVTQNNPPFNGLGPVYVRSSCESCHPGYGHGRRMERYRADDWANGYLLVVYNSQTNGYEPSVAGMPQTKAVAPFKAPIDEEKITRAAIFMALGGS